MVACLPPVLTSAITLGFTGHTPLLLAASVATGSMVGSFVGAQFALSLTDSQVKVGFLLVSKQTDYRSYTCSHTCVFRYVIQLRQLYMASLVVLGGRSLLASFGNISRIIRQRGAK
jgi:hypothetical protein